MKRPGSLERAQLQSRGVLLVVGRGRSGLRQREGDLEPSQMGKSYGCKEPFAVFLSFPDLKPMKAKLKEELTCLMYSEVE